MNTAPASSAPASGRDASPAANRRARRAAVLVGALTFAVYLSPLREVRSGDTIPARLLPFTLLRDGDLDLDEFPWLRVAEPQPYFLRAMPDGHWRSKYPLATPLLVTPLAVPFVWWAAAHGIGDDDARFRLLTVVFERVASAALGAVAVALILLAARQIAPLRWAVAAAAVAAFGTSLWPHSLALWQHPLTALAIAGSALALLRPPTPRRALWAGILAGVAVAARPTAIMLLPILALFGWRERRAQVWWLVGPMLAGALAVAALNMVIAGRASGGYAFFLPVPALAPALGLLLSPSRGLFIYTPLAVLALDAFRRGTRPVVLRYFALMLPIYVAVFSGSTSWWAGWSYGPRFFTDIVPLLTLGALPAARRAWEHGAGRVLLIAGALWGIGVQATGVYCDHEDWNRFPVSVDKRQDRLWSWSDPQMLRSLGAGWHGGELGGVLRQLASDPRPVPLVPLDAEQLAATIEPLTPTPWRCQGGRPCTGEVRVTNRSAASIWPAYTDYGPYGVVVGAWWTGGEAPTPERGMWARLPRHLGPGDAATVRLPITVPPSPGTHTLAIGVLQDRAPDPSSGGAWIPVPVVVE